MIKIKNTDTLIDIIQKILNSNEHEIILNFPFGHPVLHNYLSLKMLKSKSKGKRLTILTTDLAAKRIGEKLGIYYSIIKDKDFFENKDISQEYLKKNFTFWEYFIFEVKKFFKKTKELFLSYTKLNKLEYISPQEKIKSSSLWLVFLGLFLATFLLVFVFYFAVNKTYIYIDPQLETHIKQKNFIFNEYGLGEIDSQDISSNKIPLKLKTNITHLEKEFNTTGIDFESAKKATGKVKFFNELRAKQTLRPKTKLVTSKGLIFETTDWVKIPAARYDSNKNLIPGEVEIEAVSLVNDRSGEFIGSRGNIKKGEIMDIMKLKHNRDKIYAKASSDFFGGSDDVLRVVGNKDVENFRKIFEGTIKKEALKELKQKILEENKQNNVKYQILNLDGLIVYSSFKTNDLSKYKPGEAIASIKISGDIKISAYVFNRDDILTKLKKEIKQMLIVGEERLVKINDDTLKIVNIIERSKDKNKKLPVKITMGVEYITSYNYDNNTSSQVLNIKNEILGLGVEEAKSILLNNKKISGVTIKLVPFFLKRISNIPENIIVKIKE